MCGVFCAGCAGPRGNMFRSYVTRISLCTGQVASGRGLPYYAKKKKKACIQSSQPAHLSASHALTYNGLDRSAYHLHQPSTRIFITVCTFYGILAFMSKKGYVDEMCSEIVQVFRQRTHSTFLCSMQLVTKLSLLWGHSYIGAFKV